MWGDREELAALMVDRLGTAIYAIQAVAGVKQPVEIPPLSRPERFEANGNGAQEPGEMAEPKRMSTPEEIRAFFRGDPSGATSGTYSES